MTNTSKNLKKKRKKFFFKWCLRHILLDFNDIEYCLFFFLQTFSNALFSIFLQAHYFNIIIEHNNEQRSNIVRDTLRTFWVQFFGRFRLNKLHQSLSRQGMAHENDRWWYAAVFENEKTNMIKKPGKFDFARWHCAVYTMCIPHSVNGRGFFFVFVFFILQCRSQL